MNSYNDGTYGTAFCSWPYSGVQNSTYLTEYDSAQATVLLVLAVIYAYYDVLVLYYWDYDCTTVLQCRTYSVRSIEYVPGSPFSMVRAHELILFIRLHLPYTEDYCITVR